MSDFENYQSSTILKEARSSLERLQGFQVTSLVQKEKLGENSFDDAVEPAKKLMGILSQISVSSLDYFPNHELTQIKQTADAIYNSFSKILGFSVDEGDVVNRKNSLIDSLWNQLQPTFSKIQPLVSYSMARTVDFGSLEQEARSAAQSVRDQSAELLKQLEDQKEAAQSVLDEVRKTAAERGVSQEAYHFQTQADTHKELGDEWQKYTAKWAMAVGVYAVLTIFLHKIPFLSPNNTFETVQLVVSKVLIFTVLAYMLTLSAKNYLSHRHNEIVNRHRQNALMTYRSLVEAGGLAETRDIVLQQAAAAIYNLQDTGYVKSSEGGGTSITEILPRTSLPISTQTAGE